MSNLNSFNIGGGIPVHAERSKRANSGFLIEYLSYLEAAVERAIDSILAPRGKIIIEPGRSVVAPSVDLIVPVNGVKPRDNNESLILSIEDGIFTSFIDHILHDWTYLFRWLDADGNEKTGPLVKATLNGRSCDSGDRIYEVPVPENIERGDYLWCPNAGAYLSSVSTAFNGFNAHPYITYNSISN